jgi:large subunit ribosomal protein L9
LQLAFPVKAGETGKLYGSVTPMMLAEAIMAEKGIEINQKQLHSQPIKTLGVHKVHVRLTLDLLPEVAVIVYREGETPDSAFEEEQLEVQEEEAVGIFADLQAELEAEAAEAEVAVELEAEGEEESESAEEQQEPEPDSTVAEALPDQEGESLEQE